MMHYYMQKHVFEHQNIENFQEGFVFVSSCMAEAHLFKYFQAVVKSKQMMFQKCLKQLDSIFVLWFHPASNAISLSESS